MKQHDAYVGYGTGNSVSVCIRKSGKVDQVILPAPGTQGNPGKAQGDAPVPGMAGYGDGGNEQVQWEPDR